MARSEVNKKKIQDMNIVYRWAEKNLIEFTEEKFEQLSDGKISNTTVTASKGPTGKEIGCEGKVTDRGVDTNEKL